MRLLKPLYAIMMLWAYPLCTAQYPPCGSIHEAFLRVDAERIRCMERADVAINLHVYRLNPDAISDSFRHLSSSNHQPLRTHSWLSLSEAGVKGCALGAALYVCQQKDKLTLQHGMLLACTGTVWIWRRYKLTSWEKSYRSYAANLLQLPPEKLNQAARNARVHAVEHWLMALSLGLAPSLYRYVKLNMI